MMTKFMASSQHDKKVSTKTNFSHAVCFIKQRAREQRCDILRIQAKVQQETAEKG